MLLAGFGRQLTRSEEDSYSLSLKFCSQGGLLKGVKSVCFFHVYAVNSLQNSCLLNLVSPTLQILEKLQMLSLEAAVHKQYVRSTFFIQNQFMCLLLSGMHLAFLSGEGYLTVLSLIFCGPNMLHSHLIHVFLEKSYFSEWHNLLSIDTCSKAQNYFY